MKQNMEKKQEEMEAQLQSQKPGSTGQLQAQQAQMHKQFNVMCAKFMSGWRSPTPCRSLYLL